MNKCADVVLIIRDCPSTVVDWSGMLEASGWGVIIVDADEDAMRAAESLCPRLIVLDVTKPGSKALQSLKRLKQEAVTQPIPVLIVSSLSEGESLHFLDEGAVGYSHRGGLTSTVLSATIERILRVHSHPVRGELLSEAPRTRSIQTADIWERSGELGRH